MNAIPRYVTGKTVDPTGKYRCPLCKTQGTGDPADTGWVACPMLGEQMICLGSCIDYQKVARAQDVQNHPDRDLFDALAKRTSTPVEDLRATCLRHQLNVVDERLAEDDEDVDALKTLRLKIVRILEKV